MRSILVHADHGDAFDGRLQAALDIARARQGHVTAHVNSPYRTFIQMDPFGGTFVATEAYAQAQARDAELVDRIAARLTAEDVQWSVETSEADLVDALVSAARLEDLIVVSLTPAADRQPMQLAMPIGSIAVSARCPILAVPAGAGFSLGTPAMVAWDGSHEAANALRAAVPLLALASEVHLVTIAEKAGGFPGTEGVRYLSRHGIKAEQQEWPRGSHSVDEALLAAADALRAGLLVMGAYGHSRLRETMFGGVTKSLTDAARLPLLLAH